MVTFSLRRRTCRFRHGTRDGSGWSPKSTKNGAWDTTQGRAAHPKWNSGEATCETSRLRIKSSFGYGMVWVKIQNDLPKQIHDLLRKLANLRVHWYLMFDPYPFVFEHKKDDTHEITEPQEAAWLPHQAWVLMKKSLDQFAQENVVTAPISQTNGPKNFTLFIHAVAMQTWFRYI